jgi:hypothetical protein
MYDPLIIFGQFNPPSIVHFELFEQLTSQFNPTVAIPTFYTRDFTQALTRSIPLYFEEVKEIITNALPEVNVVKWSFYEPYFKYLPLAPWKIHETKKLIPYGSWAFTRDHNERKFLYMVGIKTLYGKRTGISATELREMLYRQDPRWKEYAFPLSERVIERPEIQERLMKLGKSPDETLRIGNLKVSLEGFTHSRKLTNLLVRLYNPIK